MMENKTQIEIFFLSIKDLFSSPMLKIAFVPFVVTSILMYFAFFSVANIGLDSLQHATVQVQTDQSSIENGVTIENHTKETYTGSSIVDFLLKYSITSWIVNFLVYTIGSFAVFWLSLFIALVIVGFLTPYILEILHKKYYPNLQIQGYGTVTNSILELVKTLLIMIGLFFLLAPFYFIPFFNIIIFNIPLYYFFHKMLHFDVGSTLLTKEQHILLKSKYTLSFRLQTLFLYFISMIPFISLILPVFYIIYLGHNYMDKMKALSS